MTEPMKDLREKVSAMLATLRAEFEAGLDTYSTAWVIARLEELDRAALAHSIPERGARLGDELRSLRQCVASAKDRHEAEAFTDQLQRKLLLNADTIIALLSTPAPVRGELDGCPPSPDGSSGKQGSSENQAAIVERRP